MKRLGAVVVSVAAVAGAAAWQGADESPVTVSTAVDAMLEEVASGPGAGAVAGTTTEATSSSTSSVRFASRLVPGRAEWDLPRTYNDRVEYWIEYLSGRNRDRTRLWLEREGRYGGLIRDRLRARGMPEDLIYLGMIESGLSPKAYSHAHASGLWQFISATGQRYGLTVSGYVDERRDPLRATDAALDYLSDLHDRFGSWYLAAAAYNSGEGRVGRILRQRAGGRTGDDALFWTIDGYLPRETRDYVPLMLAAAHIGKNPGKYGFHEVALQAPLAFEEVSVPGGVALRVVAEAAEVEVEAIDELNPHLVRGITPPGADWRVRVPEGSASRLLAALEGLTEEARLATVVHRVGRGETLSHIARRYDVAVDVIQATNGNVNPRRLHVGQRIRVPVGVGSQAAEPSWSSYRVRRGDTLWGIARRHGVSVPELRRWNGIESRIYPGQRLRIAV